MERRKLEEILAMSPIICIDMKSWLPTLWAKRLDSNSALEKIEPWGLLRGSDGFNELGVSRGNEGDSSQDVPALETLCGLCICVKWDEKIIVWSMKHTHTPPHNTALHAWYSHFYITTPPAITTGFLGAWFNFSSCLNSFSALFPTCSAVNHFIPFPVTNRKKPGRLACN